MLSMADRLGYLPLHDRPRIRWPNGERVAFWIGLNVEFFQFMPAQSRGGQELSGGNPRYPPPDIQTFVRRDYGNRIGFWRMLDVFDRHGIRCTVNINVALLDHFPEERDAMLERGWEFCFHGFYNTRNDPKGFTEEQERALYREGIAALERTTGSRPRGSNLLGRATELTPDLLAEEGFLYQADWFHDDQPTPIKVRNGRLVSVPYSAEINDSLLVSRNRGLELDYLEEIGRDQFDRLYDEGDGNGMVMCVALHPWVTGYPWRIDYLDRLLGYVLKHDGVWQTTAGDIAEHYIDNHYDEAVAHLEMLDREQGSDA